MTTGWDPDVALVPANAGRVKLSPRILHPLSLLHHSIPSRIDLQRPEATQAPDTQNAPGR